MLGRGKLEDAAVQDVRDDDVAVRQRVRVVGVVEIACPSTRDAVMAVLPHDPARRDVDAVDDLVRLVVGYDRPPVGRDERVVGCEQLAAGQALRARELPQDPSTLIDEEQAARCRDRRSAGRRGSDRRVR